MHLRNFGYASVSQKIPGGFFLRNFICIVFSKMAYFISLLIARDDADYYQQLLSKLLIRS